MKRFLPAFRPLLQLSCVVALGLLAACGTRREDFLGARVQDACDGTWPVCGSVSGCLIGEQSYVEGGFPGTQRFVIQLTEPSTVRVRMYLDSLTSQGNATTVDFFEDGCSSRVQQTATGQQFADESRQMGEFDREADLTGIGDHLITVTSDAQARYALQIEIVPKRDQL